LKELLVDAFPNEIEEFLLVPGAGGSFEIRIDGQLVFSKLQTGHFPGNDDMVDLISARLKP